MKWKLWEHQQPDCCNCADIPTIPRLAIVADDLTGALDAAAPLAAAGVAVATRPETLPRALATGAAVVAVSTRSREIDADTAQARVAGILALLPSGTRLIKKIDSRLKGNIAAELEPFNARPLVVLPAIPEFGRVVRNGSLEGFGVARPLSVRSALERSAPAARIPDIVTQDDLVGQVAAAPADAVLVGARGLTKALAEVMGIAAPPAGPPFSAPACFAVGSSDPITLAQVGVLRAAIRDLAYFPAPGGRVPPWPGGKPRAAVSLLQIMPGRESRPSLVAAEFAGSGANHLRAARSLLLTGGATAEAVFDALGIDLLEVVGEALPGMALCRSGAQAFVTKSGGFGEPDAFVRLAPRSAT